MAILNPSEAMGDVIPMKLTNPKHLGKDGEPEAPEGNTFQTVLGRIIAGGTARANELQQESFTLNQAFITDPDSVDSHDVTIAMQKANMALEITKAIVDRALQSYREIINLR